MLHARRGLLPDGLVRTEMAEGASIDAKIFADENPVVKALQLSNYKQLMQPLPQRRPEHDVRPLVKRNFDIEDDGQPGRDANDAATADGAVAAPVPAAATGARPRAASVMLPAPGVSRPLRAQKSPVLLRTAVLSLEQPNRQAFRPNGVSGASGVASATRSPLPSVRLRPRRVR